MALADFGRDPRSNDSLGGSRNLFFFSVMRITHDLTDFPSDKFYDISTQNVDRCRHVNFRNKILKILP